MKMKLLHCIGGRYVMFAMVHMRLPVYHFTCYGRKYDLAWLFNNSPILSPVWGTDAKWHSWNRPVPWLHTSQK